MLVAAFLLAVRAWPRGDAKQPNSSPRLAAFIAAGAWFTLLAAWLVYSPWLAMLAALLLASALC